MVMSAVAQIEGRNAVANSTYVVAIVQGDKVVSIAVSARNRDLLDDTHLSYHPFDHDGVQAEVFVIVDGCEQALPFSQRSHLAFV